MARKLLLPGCAVLALLLVAAVYRPAQAGPMHGLYGAGLQGLGVAREDSQIVQMVRNRGRGRSFSGRSFSRRSFGRRSFSRRSFGSRSFSRRSFNGHSHSRSHRRHGHRHHHARRTIILGAPFLYDYYDDFYAFPDHCEWLQRKALSTGSRYWWNRYYDCRYDN